LAFSPTEFTCIRFKQACPPLCSAWVSADDMRTAIGSGTDACFHWGASFLEARAKAPSVPRPPRTGILIPAPRDGQGMGGLHTGDDQAAHSRSARAASGRQGRTGRGTQCVMECRPAWP